MQVWTCAARGSLKIHDAKKSPKIRHLRTIAQLCTISLQLRHVSTVGNKLVKQQYLLHMFSQYGELRPISGWDRFTTLGHPSKFQWVSGLGFVTAPTSLNGGQPHFARCLAVSWAGALYIYFREFLPPNGIYLQRYCMSLEYTGRQPNFAAFSRGRHLYSAGRPSRWASAHILVNKFNTFFRTRCICVFIMVYHIKFRYVWMCTSIRASKYHNQA